MRAQLAVVVAVALLLSGMWPGRGPGNPGDTFLGQGGLGWGVPSVDALANPPVLNQPSIPLLISEFRLRGINGVDDEFVEIYNNSDNLHTVQATDNSAGYAVVGSDGVSGFAIPNGTVIPARGHFLGCTTNYSLTSYPAGNGTTATCDFTYRNEIADNAGIALFNTSTATKFTLANRIDAVGAVSEANALFKKGDGYPTLNPLSIDYTFVRLLNPDGRPKNTNNNAADFQFVDTNGTQLGAGQRLGAPGPENLSSPISGNGALAVSALDSCVGNGAAPNVVRDPTPDFANNSSLGTLDIRRTITNNSGQPLTRLRFRIVDLTTFPSPQGVSDLRPRTTGEARVAVDRPPCGTETSAAAVQGTTLEQPPTQFNGGGINSSLSVDGVNTTTPLANGASVDVHFRLGLQQTGTVRFKVIVEALPGGSGSFEISGDSETGLTNTSPTVTAPSAPLTYPAGNPPAVIDASATVTDADSANFAGGSLVASLFQNGTSEDRLAIRNQGTGAGQVGVAANTVTFGGTGIATFTGGSGTTPLSLAFNNAATPAAVQAVMQNVTFFTSTTAPATGPRTIEFAVNDGDGGVTSAFQTVNVGDVADLAITKTAPTTTNAGQNLTYALTATNNGPAGASNVTVTDTLPAGVTFVSATSGQGTCTQVSGIVTCAVGTLANGASTTLAIVVTPKDGGTIANTATISSPTGDSNPANNTATASTTVTAQADLAIVLSTVPSPATVGGALTYSAVVTNNGPSAATGVTATISWPAVVKFGSAAAGQGTCTPSTGQVACALGTIPSGTSVSIAVAVTGTTPASITTNASTTSPVTDPNTANNAAKVDTSIVAGAGNADLAITLAASPDPVTVGSVLTYTATVKNNGADAATAVQFVAALPSGATAGGSTPAQGTCTDSPGTVTCALGNLASGASTTVVIRVTPTVAGTAALAASVTSGVPDKSLANNVLALNTTVKAAPVGGAQPPAGVCSPRPPVQSNVVRQGSALQVTLTAGTNSGTPTNTLIQLRFGSAVNALIDIPNGQSNLQGSVDISLPAGTTQTTFLVRKKAPGSAVTVPLVIQDDCGDFPTFVGGGAATFQ